jgi:sugar phosphate isomerase/epimerase
VLPIRRGHSNTGNRLSDDRLHNSWCGCNPTALLDGSDDAMSDDRLEKVLNRIVELHEQLDAARAETADARAEVARLNAWADGFSDAQLKERRLAEEVIRELRVFAADLMDGLAGFQDHFAGHFDSECPECAAWKEGIESLLARAEALGVKQSDRAPHICPRCGTLYRGDDRHACAPRDGEKEKG